MKAFFLALLFLFAINTSVMAAPKEVPKTVWSLPLKIKVGAGLTDMNTTMNSIPINRFRPKPFGSLIGIQFTIKF